MIEGAKTYRQTATRTDLFLSGQNDLTGPDVIVRPSGRGAVHSRPHKIFLHFHDLLTLLNKIR